MLSPCLASVSSSARSIFNDVIRGLEEDGVRLLPNGKVTRTTPSHYTLQLEGIEMVFWRAGDGEQVIPCTIEQGNYYDIVADIFPNGEIERMYSSEKQARLKDLADSWITSTFTFEDVGKQLTLPIAA